MSIKLQNVIVLPFHAHLFSSFSPLFRETALRCSGLDWQTVQPCARWMEPFFHVISKKAPYLQLNEQNEQVTNRFGLSHICPNIVTDDSHIIQTHTTTMDMYVSITEVKDGLTESMCCNRLLMGMYLL